MATCDEIKALATLYLDDELQGVERADFEAHILCCRSCREAVAEAEEFVRKLRTAGPLYDVPSQLRERIERMVEENAEGASYRTPARLREHVEEMIEASIQGGHFGRASRRRWLAAAVVLLFVLPGIIWYAARFRSQALSEFALVAADTHFRRMRGQLPLEIKTTSPQQVSDWFVGKVPFYLKLPNYGASQDEQKPYELEGARLVGFKGDYAAYVSYRMGGKLISLLVTSEDMARPSGGEKIVSRGLTFHFQSYNGLKVITWTDRGLTYALVSDLEERGQRSCLVCHQEAEGRQLIEPLKKN